MKLEAAMDAIAEKDLDAARKEIQKGKTILTKPQNTFSALDHSNSVDNMASNHRQWEFMEGDACDIKFYLRESLVFFGK